MISKTIQAQQVTINEVASSSCLFWNKVLYAFGVYSLSQGEYLDLNVSMAFSNLQQQWEIEDIFRIEGNILYNYFCPSTVYSSKFWKLVIMFTWVHKMCDAMCSWEMANEAIFRNSFLTTNFTQEVNVPTTAYFNKVLNIASGYYT